jgi:hypothetical protein
MDLRTLKHAFFPLFNMAYYPFYMRYASPAQGQRHLAGNMIIRMLVDDFAMQGVPRQALLSTVRGTNPAAMDFLWIPCRDQLGQQITCYEVVYW